MNLRSDIVVKGQHHSGNSCSGPFLDLALPRLIIATSRDFPPNEQIGDNWAEDLRTRGIKLFRQDETGAMTLRFGRNGWERKLSHRRNFSKLKPMNRRALRPKSLLKFRERKICSTRRGDRKIGISPRELFNFLKIIKVIGRDEETSIFSQRLADRAQEFWRHNPAPPVTAFWPWIGEQKIKYFH